MKSALPIFGQWPPARRVLDIFQQLILPKTMFIRTIINFLGLIYHYKHPRCHEKWITLMASLILATMSVNSLEHIFVNIFFFSDLFPHLEYMVRQRASLATAASFAERSDTRLSAPAATDLCRVLAIWQAGRCGGCQPRP